MATCQRYDETAGRLHGGMLESQGAHGRKRGWLNWAACACQSKPTSLWVIPAMQYCLDGGSIGIRHVTRPTSLSGSCYLA